MKVERFDEKHGVAKVIPSLPEDLWDLYNIIEEGDLLAARTQRVMKVGAEDSPEKTRVSVGLTIKVKKAWLDIFSGSLNVSGTIEVCPDDMEGTKGHYHTLTLKVNTPVSITKARWTNMHKRRLRAAGQARGYAVIIIALDYDDGAVARVTEAGVLEVRELRNLPLGKAEPSARQSAILLFYEDVADTAQSVSSSGKERMIIVGPGFAKDGLVRYLKEAHPELHARIVCIAGATSGTASAINEAMRRDDVKARIGDLRALNEIEWVEKFFAFLARDPKLVCYSLDDVGRALRAGAARLLLIHEHLASFLGPEGVARVDELIGMAEAKKCGILIVSSRHEGGSKLKSIGGLASFLRFPIE